MEVTLAPAGIARRRGWVPRRRGGWIGRLAPVAVGLVVALVVTSGYRQVGHPYLDHDDWEFFSPASIPHAYSILQHTLTDGRWLNLAWWHVLGQHSGPRLASATFWLGDLLFSGALAARIARGWWAAPAAVAVFVSPMVFDLSFWPESLSMSMLVLAGSVLLLPAVRGRWPLLVLWVTLVAVAGVLTYPPVASMAFLAMVVDQAHGLRPGRIAALGAWFIFSFGAAVLLSWTLNWLVSGRFGLAIASWRHPHSPRSVADLAANLSRYLGQWQATWHVLWLPMLVALLAVVAWLIARSTRAQTGTFWLWIVIVVPVVWCLRLAGPGQRRWIMLLAVAGVLTVSIWGGLGAASKVAAHQLGQHRIDATGAQVSRLRVRDPSAHVVISESARQRQQHRFYVQTRSMEMSLWDDRQIPTTRCGPTLCAQILRHGIPSHPGQSVFLDRGEIIIVPPPYAG